MIWIVTHTSCKMDTMTGNNFFLVTQAVDYSARTFHLYTRPYTDRRIPDEAKLININNFTQQTWYLISSQLQENTHYSKINLINDYKRQFIYTTESLNLSG